MHHLGGLAVIDKVGDNEVVYGVGFEYRVEIVALVGLTHLRDQLGLGVGLLVDLGDRNLGRTLVLLDVQHLFGEVGGVTVHLDALVRYHALRINITDNGDYRGLECRILSEGKGFSGPEVLVDDVFGILVVRDDA